MREAIIASVERELDLGDLAALDEPAGTKAPALTRISERHHRLARMLAEGMSPCEAAVACGYVLSRVSVLQADPSFKELVRMYRARVEEVYIGLHEKLKDLAGCATDELLHRLEETPDDIDTSELVKIVALGADRTGHGPATSTQTNVFVGFAQRLDAARARVRGSVSEAEEIKDGDL